MNQNLTHLFAEKRRKRFQILTLGFSDFQVRFFDFQRSDTPIPAFANTDFRPEVLQALS